MSLVSPSRRALAAGIALLAAACGRQPLPVSVPAPAVQAAVLYDDDAGGMRDSVRVVVRDPVAFRTLWQRATGAQPSPPPPPPVDFTREMVVAVGAGRMMPDDRIRVDSVSLRLEPGGGLRPRPTMVVLVRTTEGCRHVSAAAWPVQLVRVRRYDGPVLFVERRGRAEDCARDPASRERP